MFGFLLLKGGRVLNNSLGSFLQSHRRRCGLTQEAVATLATVSVPTIANLEGCHGSLASFFKVLNALDLEVAGRNLPAADTVGQRIALLRQRRDLSQRAVLPLVNISQPTLVALERRSCGRLETLDAILAVLGAGAYLAPVGSVKPFYVHAGNSTGQNSWTTPPWLTERLQHVFGRFDLDPCASRRGSTFATITFTSADDGLSLSWHGAVFMNPPYDRQLGVWMSKAAAEYHARHAAVVVALVPARTDTHWWHQAITNGVRVLFLKGRLKFGSGKQSAPFPSALLIWGASEAQLSALRLVFPDAWMQG